MKSRDTTHETKKQEVKKVDYKNLFTPFRIGEMVVVIGGGPGGIEAARSAAIAGNEVMLFEKDSDRGGQLKNAATPDFKSQSANIRLLQKK